VAESWRRGDDATVDALAALELRSLDHESLEQDRQVPKISRVWLTAV
jgi:hypothetical protein